MKPISKFHEALGLHKSGDLKGAQTLYEEILKKNPRDAESLHLLGLIAAQSGDSKRAVTLIGKSIRADPDNAVTYFNRGSALQQLKQYDAALDDYDHAIEMQSAFAAAHHNRGGVLLELERFEEALASYDQEIAIQPQHEAAWLHRGNVLASLRRWDAALASYNHAIAIRPELAVAHCNRGNVLKELNRLDEALDSYSRAIEIQPDYAVAYANRAVTLLLAGELERGWTEFEWRWKIEPSVSKGMRFRPPSWRGEEPLAGKTLLLHAEQGFGDTLQFCRYVPLVEELGARVVLRVQKPLTTLLCGLPGVMRMAGHADTLADIDYQCPLMSLPLAFKTTLATIPAPTRYLHGAPGKVAHWQAKLGTPSKPRVGLVWSGGTGGKNDNRRVPFEELIRQLPAEIQYVSLQKELHAVDEASLRGHSQILNFSDNLIDFSDTAALCECLDLVISVDTSVAHLSAALGKTTWILLACSPDWRWLLHRSDSPWYPSARLYRQDSIGDWRRVLAKVGADLKRFADQWYENVLPSLRAD